MPKELQKHREILPQPTDVVSRRKLPRNNDIYVEFWKSLRNTRGGNYMTEFKEPGNNLP